MPGSEVIERARMSQQGWAKSDVVEKLTLSCPHAVLLREEAAIDVVAANWQWWIASGREAVEELEFDC